MTEFQASSDKLIRIVRGKQYKFNYPDSIAVDHAAVWVSNLYGYSVTEFAKATGKLLRVIKGTKFGLVRARQGVQGRPYGFSLPDSITSDGSRVWVANHGANSVT